VSTATSDTLPRGWVVHAFRFALDPTPSQQEMLRSHCGAARFAFNHMLGVVKTNLDQRAAERSYGISGDALTPSQNWSAYGLRKTWNQIKNDIAPWWRENSKEAYASGLANLAAALSNWAASRSGERRGPRMRFPRFKTKKSLLSCRFTTGAFGLVDADRRHVKLPRIGLVRTHESTRKLARRIAAGTARIRSASVTFTQGRWFVSFSVEVRYTRRPPAPPEMVVGVDLGVKHLAVLSARCPGSLTSTAWWPIRTTSNMPSGRCAGCSAKPLADMGPTTDPPPSRPSAGSAPMRRSSGYTRGSRGHVLMVYTNSPPR
jgi:putative transposase